MSLNIKIENFEGPFDLLLHLIKKNKMDIYDVKIHEITNQYVEYIHNIEEMDLELTSEFVVMASTLLEIKSRMLLPKYVLIGEDDKEEENPEKELMKKLIEYSKFKKAAKFLEDRKCKVGRNFSKKPEIIVKKKDILKPENFMKDLTILKLYNIYYKLMSIYMEKSNMENRIERKISADKFKVEDKINYIKVNTKIGQVFEFSNILNECKFKIEKIVTFMALLELMKLGIISAAQNGNFKEIYIERIVEIEG
ncbi:segregation/condensation protein A [Clostridium sp. LBM24168]